MKRYGSVIGLKAEKIDEYKRLHAEVWPAVLAKISECNIQNYSIYLREPENLLFSYFITKFFHPFMTDRKNIVNKPNGVRIVLFLKHTHLFHH